MDMDVFVAGILCGVGIVVLFAMIVIGIFSKFK